jgi:ketosteroid isomerase-like protein
MNEHEHQHEHDLSDDEDAFLITDELLERNQQLLQAIAAGDWETYAGLCDPTITCFEPEARGHLVDGMEFHKFYFDLGGPNESLKVTTMASPHVRILGDSAAVISYVRLNQRIGADGEPVVTAVEETRVWERLDGEWKHVHFHRSKAP